MIKINLFPVRQARQQEIGKLHAVIGMAVILVVLSVIFIFHGYQMSANGRIKFKNAKLRAEIDALKKELGDYEKVKAQRAELQRQRDAIQKLQTNRAGPVYLMRELSDILSKGKGPTFDKAEYEENLRRDPNAGFNPNWDPRRLWITSWDEKQHEVTVKGRAKSSDDVAEFTKRLKISPFFSGVYWQQTKPDIDKPTKVPHVVFDLRCRVVY